MKRTVPLTKSAQGVANGAGTGTVQLGPQLYGDEWTAESAFMQASSNTAEASGTIYLGGPTVNNARGQTASASSGDTATLASVKLRQGQFITAQWVGADPGATLTLTLYGERTIEGG